MKKRELLLRIEVLEAEVAELKRKEMLRQHEYRLTVYPSDDLDYRGAFQRGPSDWAAIYRDGKRIA